MSTATFPAGENLPTQFRVFGTSTHVQRRLNKIAPMAYGVMIEREPPAPPLWGWGVEKSTEAMLAHGLVRAVADIFNECEEPTIEVITPAVGIDLYVTEYVPEWMRQLQLNPKFSRDSLRLWKEFYLMALLGNLRVRLPENREEKAQCKRLHQLAEAKANDAYKAFRQNRSRFATPGEYVTDADEEAGGI
jgi:hypothetical protein